MAILEFIISILLVVIMGFIAIFLCLLTDYKELLWGEKTDE